MANDDLKSDSKVLSARFDDSVRLLNRHSDFIKKIIDEQITDAASVSGLVSIIKTSIDRLCEIKDILAKNRYLIDESIIAIGTFESEIATTKQSHTGILNPQVRLSDLRGSFSSTANVLATLVSMSRVMSSNDEFLYGDMKKSAAVLIDEMKIDFAKMMSDQKEEFDKVQTSIKYINETASKVAVGSHAIHFSTAAEQHKKSAKKWFVAVVLVVFLIIGTAGLGGYLFYRWHGSSGLDATILPHLILAKVGVLAAEAYFLFLCTKNYHSNIHNYVVNQHRANALNTYRALVDGIHDQSTKDIVLTQAAQCIFGAQETGFTKQSGESSAPNIFQILQKDSNP